MIATVTIGFYLGGVVAVLPILLASPANEGSDETLPFVTALRLAVCWPFHPWRVG